MSNQERQIPVSVRCFTTCKVLSKYLNLFNSHTIVGQNIIIHTFYIRKLRRRGYLLWPKLCSSQRSELQLTLFDSFTNIPEKYQKSIEKYVTQEIRAVFDLSNLNIFQISNGALEHAVLLVFGLNFCMYFLMDILLHLVGRFYSTVKRELHLKYIFRY